MDKGRIIGARIAEVRYSELNDPEGQWCFDGFDSIDLGIHIRMSDGAWWSFLWTEDEIFELVEGMEQPTFWDKESVKTWDASDQWTRYAGHAVRDVEISYVDEDAGLVDRCIIVFDNDLRVTLLVAEELTPGEPRPSSVEYDMGGHLYIIHDQQLLHELDERDQDQG